MLVRSVIQDREIAIHVFFNDICLITELVALNILWTILKKVKDMHWLTKVHSDSSGCSQDIAPKSLNMENIGKALEKNEHINPSLQRNFLQKHIPTWNWVFYLSEVTEEIVLGGQSKLRIQIPNYQDVIINKRNYMPPGVCQIFRLSLWHLKILSSHTPHKRLNLCVYVRARARERVCVCVCNQGAYGVSIIKEVKRNDHWPLYHKPVEYDILCHASKIKFLFV